MRLQRCSFTKSQKVMIKWAHITWTYPLLVTTDSTMSYHGLLEQHSHARFRINVFVLEYIFNLLILWYVVHWKTDFRLRNVITTTSDLNIISCRSGIDIRTTCICDMRIRNWFVGGHNIWSGIGSRFLSRHINHLIGVQGVVAVIDHLDIKIFNMRNHIQCLYIRLRHRIVKSDVVRFRCSINAVLNCGIQIIILAEESLISVLKLFALLEYSVGRVGVSKTIGRASISKSTKDVARFFLSTVWVFVLLSFSEIIRAWV